MLSLACKFQSLESDREIIPVLDVRVPIHEPYNGKKNRWWLREEGPLLREVPVPVPLDLLV